jgi:hypothetical protein
VGNRRPFPISTAIDALVESEDPDAWCASLPADQARLCLAEAIAQLRWYAEVHDGD